jgi:hypothetical protein
MNRKLFGLSIALVLSSFISSAFGQHTDNPPQAQSPESHSTITVSDGMGGQSEVRDDDLANMIKSAIDNSGKRPSSVKVFFNSCYGGGMLDNIADMLGNYSPAIPFIGGSASTADQGAWGTWGATAENGKGSSWTDSLSEAINNSGNNERVVETLEEAKANDVNSPHSETPQVTSAHGGANVEWSSRAQSVVFSGFNTAPRHDNNVTNMEQALLNNFEQPQSNVFSSGSGIDPTQAALQSLLDQAANALASDGSEELVLYVDDHGGWTYDVKEWAQTFDIDEINFDSENGWSSSLDPNGDGNTQQPELTPGQTQGLSQNEAQGDSTNPGLFLTPDIIDPFDFDAHFDAFFNGVWLDLPPVLAPGGPAFIPIPWEAFQAGPNQLQFLPAQPGLGPSLSLVELELTSGPLNHFLAPIPEPTAFALFTVAAVCLAAGRHRQR